MTEATVVERALLYLAGRCDFAQSRDGAGFNKLDAGFGHDLAALVAAGTMLSETQVAASLKMLRTYSKQLEAADIILPEKGPEVAPRPVGKVVRAELAGGIVNLSFAYDAGLVDIIRAVEGRRWDAMNKRWSVPISAFPALVERLRKAGAEVPGLDDLAMRIGKGEPVDAREMVNIHLADGALSVRFPYDPKLVEIVKAVEGRQWDKEKKIWTVPVIAYDGLVENLKAAGCKVMVGVSVNDAVEKAKEREAEKAKLAEMSNRAETGFAVPGLRRELYPFQRAGVEFLHRSVTKGVILADSMGLGKSAQAIAYLVMHPELRPAVVVCPASVKLNWQREIAKFSDLSSQVLFGTKAGEIADVDVTVLNYDIVGDWLEKLNSKCVILDEAAKIKEMKAQRTKNCRKLAAKAQKVLMLTGTPVLNRPSELFSLLNLASPGEFPKFFPYAMNFCNAQQTRWGWDFSGASNLDELYRKTRHLIVRRTKEQVLPELPAKTRTTVPVEMDKRQQYRAVLAETEEMLRSAQKLGVNHLAQIEKLKQAAVLGKMTFAIEWMEDFIEANGKLVVFVVHQAVAHEVRERFKDVAVIITGETSQKARQDAVDAFQDDPKVRLLIGNIEAAGLGITLTAASDVAFLELAWSPAVHDQSESRCHRIGQQDAVNCWYLVGVDTIDEDIVELLEAKRGIVDAVTDGTDKSLRFDMLEQLAKRIMEKEGREA